MSKAEDRLRELAAARDVARDALNRRIAQARDLAKPATLAKRAQNEITIRAQDLSTQAIEIASDNRGILVGMGIALLGWLLRRPLMNKAKLLNARRCRAQVEAEEAPPAD